MVRRLIATTILLVVAVILVSPCVDMDNAVNYHQHHHHFGLSVNTEDARTASPDDRFEGAVDRKTIDVSASPSSSAMRC